MSVIYSHCSVLSMPQPSVNIMVCFYNCSNLGTMERLCVFKCHNALNTGADKLTDTQT